MEKSHLCRKLVEKNSMEKPENENFVPDEVVLNRMFLIRGEKVMLDRDLASLYQVETKQLKRAVRRNIERFPGDFMFELNEEEMELLRCQIGTSSWGGTRYAPMAFTEQGVAMLSSVLNSPCAIQVNIQIMRVFTRLRKAFGSHEELIAKLSELENRIGQQDEQIGSLFSYLKQFLEQQEKPRELVGFRINEQPKSV